MTHPNHRAEPGRTPLENCRTPLRRVSEHLNEHKTNPAEHGRRGGP